MRSVSRHVFVSLAALACATAAGAQNPGIAKRNSNQIVREELLAASAANAYELVQALRPQWLRERGNETIRTQKVERPNGRGRIEVATIMDEPDILVYINNSRFGNVDALRDIPVTGLGALEFVSPSKATLRWGSGHTKGVIVVYTSIGGTSP
jgi:hypothetical protein